MLLRLEFVCLPLVNMCIDCAEIGSRRRGVDARVCAYKCHPIPKPKPKPTWLAYPIPIRGGFTAPTKQQQGLMLDVMCRVGSVHG